MGTCTRPGATRSSQLAEDSVMLTRCIQSRTCCCAAHPRKALSIVLIPPLVVIRGIRIRELRLLHRVAVRFPSMHARVHARTVSATVKAAVVLHGVGAATPTGIVAIGHHRPLCGRRGFSCRPPAWEPPRADGDEDGGDADADAYADGDVVGLRVVRRAVRRCRGGVGGG